MPSKLTEVTDKTLKEVISLEVILPSTYQEHFENHAKIMQLDIDYETTLEKETHNKLEEAHALMDKTTCSLDSLYQSTQNAQDAIREKDDTKLSSVVKEIETLKSSLTDLKKQLHTDSLTKLYNRKWLSENLVHEGEFIRNGVFIFIDIDKFKSINDTYGHIIGDKVLQYISAFLKTSLKETDIVRYAGDEFIVISKHSQMQQCFTNIKKLQEDLLSKRLKATNGEPLYLSFSFGITKFEIGSNFRDTLEIADSLMYENKKAKEKN